MYKVLIMLSTYNGEKYICEQMNSLYEQKDVEFHLLVRDDGSKDRTCQIIESYRERFHNIDLIRAENVGVVRSFHLLITEAINNYSGYDYYAFCDQDDVWYNDKLITACNKLRDSNQRYKFYFCDPEIVDESLASKKVKKIIIRNNLHGNIIANHIQGCTMVFNYSLLKKASLLSKDVTSFSSVKRIPIHDAWIAAVAYALDSYIVYDQNPHIKYRQHEGNVVGAGHGRIKVLVDRIIRYKNGDGKKLQKCDFLRYYLYDDIPNENKTIVDKFVEYKKSYKAKFALLFDHDIYQYDLMTNVGLFFMILINKF